MTSFQHIFLTNTVHVQYELHVLGKKKTLNLNVTYTVTRSIYSLFLPCTFLHLINKRVQVLSFFQDDFFYLESVNTVVFSGFFFTVESKRNKANHTQCVGNLHFYFSFKRVASLLSSEDCYLNNSIIYC